MVLNVDAGSVAQQLGGRTEAAPPNYPPLWAPLMALAGAGLALGACPIAPKTSLKPPHYVRS